MWQDVTLIIGAYLLGSVPHLAALARIRGIRIERDQHIILWLKGGRLVGLVGIILDMAKGVAPVLIGKLLDFNIAIITLAGLAAVAGQMWPVFSKYNGEKGNTPGVGMGATLAILPCAIAAVAWAIAAGIKTLPRLWRNRSLNEWTRFGGPSSNCLPVGMITGFLFLPIASLVFNQPMVVTVGFVVLLLLILIRRVTAGLKADLKSKKSFWSIVFNRMLLDRSYR